MKRLIRRQVFIFFMFFMILALTFFVMGHYKLIKEQYRNIALQEVDISSQLIAADLEEILGRLEKDAAYLGKDLKYLNEKPIYLIQNFLKQHIGIEAIYLYDEGFHQIGFYKLDDGYDQIVQNIVKELFYYTPIEWVHLKDNMYCMMQSVQGETPYFIGYVIDMENLFETFSLDPSEQATLYDGFGYPIVATLNGRKDKLSLETYKEPLLNGERATFSDAGQFISHRSLNYKGIDLFLYLQISDQNYVGALRLYKVRIIAITLFLVTIGLLAAWKLINKLYGLYLIDTLSGQDKAKEFIQIKNELGKAIIWIDDVVLHYDELNKLKEELIELNDKLPKEDDGYVGKKRRK